jgi:hypothetical protein
MNNCMLHLQSEVSTHIWLLKMHVKKEVDIHPRVEDSLSILGVAYEVKIQFPSRRILGGEMINHT